MTLPTSNSNQAEAAFELLSPTIKKWVWKQKWAALRDIQTEAIPHIIIGGDAIISAATAGGKTEAAFLPLLSRTENQRATRSFDLLYISPLKALINDQHRRLEELCEDLKLPLTKWHGDVSSSIKQKALKNPSGILLITPESLEALLMRRGLQVPMLFQDTQAIIIDELHAFMNTERGVQLRSLMNRVEILINRKIDRIGLSATLGDMEMAAQYLRSNSKKKIPIIKGKSGGTELQLQLRSYLLEYPNDENNQTPELPEKQIADHLFDKLRGSQNLIFAGSKQNVELYSATLRDLCENASLPNEFFTHHANISKGDREALERRLKDGHLPTSAVCTSTLELGIDIGDVDTVAQIGCSGSVSALRQRMGRSGRRAGAATKLRAYNRSFELDKNANLIDMIRPRLIQAIAEIELLLEGVYEPPNTESLHLSTLVHQILSVITERGGIKAQELFHILSHSAPFDRIPAKMFKDILRAIARPGTDLIEQSPDGTLLLGREGEILTSSYKFYAVFETEDEFRVLCAGKDLGTLPITGPTVKGMIIIFSGRRWQIIEVHPDEKVIEVKASKGGSPPKFNGNGPSRHHIIDEKMRSIYSSQDIPRYLDPNAKSLLLEGRESFTHFQLPHANFLEQGDGVLLFPWAGSAMVNTLVMIFQYLNYTVENEDYALFIQGLSVQGLEKHLKNFESGKLPDLHSVCSTVVNKSTGQYDHYLTDHLLVEQLVSTMPNMTELRAWAQSILSNL